MMPPKKSYGQHFLHSPHVVEEILTTLSPKPDELVLEIGPGRGALTAPLAKLVGDARLLLVEADRDLVPALAVTYPAAQIITADAAQLDYDAATVGRPWVAVGNLPYNAGAAIVQQLLAAHNAPHVMVVMLQREVAERMLGVTRGLLTIAVELSATVTRVCNVPPGAFFPVPKVDSCVIALHPRPETVGDTRQERAAALELARVGFAHRRKRLAGNLVATGKGDMSTVAALLARAGISAAARAEVVTRTQWLALVS